MNKNLLYTFNKEEWTYIKGWMRLETYMYIHKLNSLHKGLFSHNILKYHQNSLKNLKNYVLKDNVLGKFLLLSSKSTLFGFDEGLDYLL